METVVLSNGVKMPILGFGVFQVPDLEECERVVTEAIKVGYRLLDTAQVYGNEEAVGNAVRKSGLAREEFFITTKVWISNAGYEKAKASLDESLRKLQTDYVDLVLIHQPFGDYYGTWRALEAYYKSGKIKAIGVSNFYPERLVDLASFNEIYLWSTKSKPMFLINRLKLKRLVRNTVFSWNLGDLLQKVKIISLLIQL